MNYLNHHPIVVFILGNESSFKEAVLIDIFKKDNIPRIFDKNDEIIEDRPLLNNRNQRAWEFIFKILPETFKYNLNEFDIEKVLDFRPYGRKKENEISLWEKLSKNDFSKFFKKQGLNIIDLEEEYSAIKKSGEKYAGFDIDFETFQSMKIDVQKEFFNEYFKAIPVSPRGLINLYQADFPNELKSLKTFKGISKKIIEEISESNFKILSDWYEKLFNCNPDIHLKKIEVGVKDVILLDKFSRKFIIDFSKVFIESSNSWSYGEFNTSRDLLLMKYWDTKKKNDISISKERYLTSAQSAFIQMFYDLIKVYLSPLNYEMKNDKLFNWVNIYLKELDITIDLPKLRSVLRKERVRIVVTSPKFNFFLSYYLFKEMYSLYVPLIIKDRKKPRDILNRLKAFFSISIEIINKHEDRIISSRNLAYPITEKLYWKDVEGAKEIYGLLNLLSDVPVNKEFDKIIVYSRMEEALEKYNKNKDFSAYEKETAEINNQKAFLYSFTPVEFIEYFNTNENTVKKTDWINPRHERNTPMDINKDLAKQEKEFLTKDNIGDSLFFEIEEIIKKITNNKRGWVLKLREILRDKEKRSLLRSYYLKLNIQDVKENNKEMIKAELENVLNNKATALY